MRAEMRKQFLTGAGGQQSGAHGGRVREESAREFGGGIQDAGQFQGAQRRQIGVQGRYGAVGP
jgi:hypothetical protein